MVRRGVAVALIAVVAGFALVAQSSRAHAVAPIVAAVVAPLAVEGVLVLVDGALRTYRPTTLHTPGGQAARGIATGRNGARITGLSSRGRIIAGGAALAVGSAAFRGEDIEAYLWDDPDAGILEARWVGGWDPALPAGYSVVFPYCGGGSASCFFQFVNPATVQFTAGWEPSSSTSLNRAAPGSRWPATGFMTPPGDLATVTIGNTQGTVIGRWERSQAVWVEPDPDAEHEARRIGARGTCVGGDGSRRTVEAFGPWYTSGSGAMPNLSCNPGERLAGLDVFRESSNESVPARTLFDMPVNEDELDPSHPYYDCMVGAPCELMLFAKQADGTLVSCNVDPQACVGWEKRQDREAAFVCMWGPYTLDLAQCAAYQGAWDGTADLDNPLREDHSGSPQLDAPGSGPSESEGPIRSALSWAFVPTNTPQLFQRFQQEASGRPPFSIGSGIGGLIGGVVDGWRSGGACGQFPAMWDDSVAGAHRLPCDPGQTVGQGVWSPIYVLMQGVIVAIGGWSLWALARRSIDAD